MERFVHLPTSDPKLKKVQERIRLFLLKGRGELSSYIEGKLHPPKRGKKCLGRCCGGR